jgi:chemosensory pili system protein ChpA (sensor histidine kinase/response regulator)
MAEEIGAVFPDVSGADLAKLGAAAEKYSRTASAINLAAVERMAKTISDTVNRFVGRTPILRNDKSPDVSEGVLAAFGAFTRHVRDVGNGRKVTPLSMGSSYARLIEICGDRIPLPGEFFLPYIPDTTSWCKISAAPVDESAFVAEMAKTRASFERAFLAFHKERQANSLIEMRRVLQALQAKNPHLELALFLEAAVTAMECIDPDSMVQDDFGILMRVNIELGWLIKSKGVMEPDGYLVSALLYHVARKARRSARASRLCQKLQLSRYLDFSDEHLLLIYEKFMAAMPKIQEAWSKVPDPTFMSAFGKMLSQIVSHGGALRNFQFIAVANGINALFGKLAAGALEFSEGIAIEIAFDLILLEEMLDSDAYEREAEQWRVDAAVDRLGRLAMKQEVDSRAVEITEKQRIHAMSSACAQLKSEMETLEDALVKANDGESADMGTIKRLFSKMNGVFFALGLDDAMTLLRKASKMADMFLVMEDEEKAALAEMVAFIGMYVGYLADGNLESAQEVMVKAQELFLVNERAAAASLIVETPEAELNSDIESADDDDMLEIYLDEAAGVIKSIGASVAQFGTHRQVEALTAIRRGFHTLKGSARMVGLQRLGNVAWDVERVLNRYIAHHNAVTPALVRMIMDGNTFFSEKIAEMKERRRVRVDDQIMSAMAMELLSVDISAAPKILVKAPAPVVTDDALAMDLALDDVALAITSDPSAPDAPMDAFCAASAEAVEASPGAVETIVDSECVIAVAMTNDTPGHHGDIQNTTDPAAADSPLDDNRDPVVLTARVGGDTITVEAWLYDLYVKEMEKLIARMNDGLDTLRSSGVVIHGLMRAVHTAASNSATAGFTDVYNLAHALEMLVAPHVDEPMSYVNEDISLIETAIQAIQTAYGFAVNKIIPEASPEIVSRLELEISASAQQDISMSGAPGNYDLGMDNMESSEKSSPTSCVDEAVEVDADTVASMEGALPEPVVSAEGPVEAGKSGDSDVGSLGGDTMAGIAVSHEHEHEGECLGTGLATSEDVPMARTAPDGDSPVILDMPTTVADCVIAEGPGTEGLSGDIESLSDLSFDLPAMDSNEATTLSSDRRSPHGPVHFQPPTIGADIEDDIDPNVLPVFLDEARRIMETLPELLRRWVDENDQVAMREILRASHTMKGSARMAGVMRYGTLMHGLETMLDSIKKVSSESMPGFKSAVESGYDLASILIDRYRSNEDVSSIGSLADARGMPASEGSPVVVDRRASNGDVGVLEDRRAPIGRNTVHIPVARLDAMELAVAESLLSLSKTEGFTGMGRESEERLRDNIKRMSSLMRQLTIHMDTQMDAGSKALSRLAVKDNWDSLEMDRFTRAQELTRMINECAADLGETMNDVDSALNLIMDSVHDQGRHIDDLQHEIIQSRLVPFHSLDGRLMRVLRGACRDTGKKAALEIDAEIEIDGAILEKLIAPIEHIVRNSVAHGIELPTVRAAGNKPESGLVRISAMLVGAEIQIKISDDGAGINRDKLVGIARSKGVIGEAAQVADDFADNLVFHPGLSTADAVSEIAGRGVGLDVVKGAVDALGGDVTVHSHTGQGCVFTLRAPMSASTIQAVSVSVNGHRYIVPTTLIQSIITIDGAVIDKAYKESMLPIHGDHVSRTHPFVSLGRLLELQNDDVVEIKRNNTIIVMHDDGSMPGVAIHVEGTAPFRKYVVRHLPSAPAGVMGGTIDERGNVAPIINPSVMMRQSGNATKSQVWGHSLTSTAMPRAPKAAPLVMIVDDSITVRKVTEAALKKHSFRVLHAKDGMEAWEILHDTHPDIILLDIEMPRMTGFELMELIRSSGNGAIRTLPVIMISSRGAEKHIQHAYRLGVNSYQVKPFDTARLVAEIHQQLSNTGGVRAAA